jgi:N-acyl-L-homoserine lactone synthetase
MLDGAHTDLNARALNDLIERAPWSLSALAAAGIASLDAYASFLGDCVRLADARAKGAQSHCDPRASLSWRLKTPPGWKLDRDKNGSTLDWLAEVRALRGKAFYEGGRRPAFRTPAGAFLDPDPIDRHAFHVLAYDGAKLVGCVRLYHLDLDGPACLTEKILGEKMFSQMLRTLGARRDEIVEIGRWVVDPDYCAKNRDFGLSVQLAAASAAVANALGKASRAEHGFAICAAGTKDRQDRMLTRLGMAPVAGIGPVYCEKYRDDISVLCCSSAQRLSPLLTGLIDQMADKIGLFNALGDPYLFGQGLVQRRDPSSHPAG